VKFLFVHQNFPGQYLHLVRHLQAQERHDIVFLTEANRNVIPGVRKVPYRKPDAVPRGSHWVSREFEAATRRAEVVAMAARELKGLGFTPDIILGHHGWGELLNIRDVWPDVPLLGYFEFYYRTQGADVGFDPEFPTDPADFPRIRAKNSTNLQALALGGHGQTPTEWQLSTYPAWARPMITLLAEGVDLEVCRPDAAARGAVLRIGGMEIAPEHRLVTYVARDLEPYRGVHIMLRAIPRLLRARRDLRVVMVGGDGVSYGARPKSGTWKSRFLEELGSAIDPARVCFPGRVDYATYTALLRRSDAHVYLTYPFVASWSLREALASGCVVIGSDTPTVTEFIRHGSNGLIVPFHDPAGVADAVLRVLEDARLARRLGAGARRFAERHLDMRAYLANYEALIRKLVPRGAVTPRAGSARRGTRPR